jgi:hypothetical protein
MTRQIVLLVGTLVAATVMNGRAGEQVEIRLNGRYFAAPATVQMVVSVEPDAANRTLRIEADGDNMYRSTEVALDGKTEKRLHIVEFKNLQAGTYELRAEVLSSAGVRAMATSDMQVVGR